LVFSKDKEIIGNSRLSFGRARKYGISEEDKRRRKIRFTGPDHLPDPLNERLERKVAALGGFARSWSIFGTNSGCSHRPVAAPFWDRLLLPHFPPAIARTIIERNRGIQEISIHYAPLAKENKTCTDARHRDLRRPRNAGGAVK
jgi:hypothetical protein